MKTIPADDVRRAMRTLAKLCLENQVFADALFSTIADGKANVLAVRNDDFVFALTEDIPKDDA